MVKKASKALMTIHGFLTDINDFGRLYQYVGMYDKVVACKIPGHNGKVDFRKFTVENTLQAVLHCYDQLAKDYDQVDVVGFSMGGALTTYLCTQRKVHKAILVAPANRYINLNSPLSTLKFYLRFVSDTYTKAIGSIKERIFNTQKALGPYVDNTIATSNMALRKFFPHLNMYTFNTFSNIVKAVNIEVEAHSPIDTPTLVFWGELDELVPQTSIDYLSKHFVEMQTILYDDVGHMLMISSRDVDFIRESVKFLTDGQVDNEIPPKQIGKTTSK